MREIRVAILGAGSVRCSPAVITSLATYFGERPLEIRMYDADLERLDLFDRYARLAFAATHSTHGLISTMDFNEAVEGAERVILQVGENCARKFLKERHKMGVASLGAAAMVEQAVEEMLDLVPDTADVLNLQRDEIAIPREAYRVDWQLELDKDERRAVPHQVLRWIRGEEYLHEIIRENERSPLKHWLDDVNSARLILPAQGRT